MIRARRLAEPLAAALPAVLAEDARIVTESDKRTPLELCRCRWCASAPTATRGSRSTRPVSAETAGTAVVPGSYDPVTFGHLDIIGRAANVFDNVDRGRREPAGAQAEDPVHAPRSALRSSRQQVAEYANVQVKPFDTLLVDFAREHGAKAIVKGLRAISDFEYEFEMNQLNRKMAPDIESMYMMAAPQFSFLSSSGIKELAMFGGDIERPRARSCGRPLAGRAEALKELRRVRWTYWS